MNSILPRLAAGSALLTAFLCAPVLAQPAAAPASGTSGAAAQPSQPAAPARSRSMAKRDASEAARPAGFNPRFSPEGEHFVQQGGEQLYRSICQGCHMPQGQGAQGAGMYPALAKNARLAAGAYPAFVVLKGLRGMPPFGQRLSDQQVADVVNYVRTHFGNDYRDALSAQDVAKQRP